MSMMDRLERPHILVFLKDCEVRKYLSDDVVCFNTGEEVKVDILVEELNEIPIPNSYFMTGVIDEEKTCCIKQDEYDSLIASDQAKVKQYL